VSTGGGGTDDGDAGVLVVPYERSWPDVYRAVASEICTLLGDRARKLFHAGSTSVPGLAAKSIIDVILVVDDSTDEPSYVASLAAHGYRLVVREAD
jgi:GrpB-like predicted nucleotidyltransferase (UPF0157 family)